MTEVAYRYIAEDWLRIRVTSQYFIIILMSPLLMSS